MVFTPKRSSVNQTLQFGLEATPGVNVPATKLLQCFDIVFGPMADTAPYTPTGRKYPSIVIENSEWVEGTLSGDLDYNGIVYALSGVCGAATIGASGGSATAKLWTFIPPVTGSVQPQTYTIEQGENNAYGNAIYNHKVNYGLISEFGYKLDRKTGMTLSGKVLAQALQRAITMTPTPTAVALQPSAGKHFNIYLDTSSAALGTTQLPDALTTDFTFGGLYNPFFSLNRANLGFSAHVDGKPATSFKLLAPADATQMGILSYLQAGQTVFMSVKGQGAIIDNIQTVTFGGGVTGGTFSLSYKNQTTAPITYSTALTAATVNTAFQLLSGVGSNCIVSGAAGGPYTFTFSGALASDMSAVSATNISLTGGTPTLVAAATAYAGFEHQMALKVSKPSPFSDKDGVFAEEFEFTVVEDAGWGAAHKFLVTTLLTAL